ncbi:FtsX-like permease family protein [Hydrogenophaga sp. 5NK40-0174]|uniref:FtsX-like permease family protein n=1 Tax=Hydrogenophaga sp. 5NK40-0174 TaxID=3127649 RepID=UPI00310546D2
MQISPLLRQFSWQDWRHHPWRTGAAVLAVMLGVALGLAVHLINASALSEFSSAVRTINGEPDVQVRWRNGLMPEAWYDHLALNEGVKLASPVLEQKVRGVAGETSSATVVLAGVDVLTIGQVAPQLMPRPDDTESSRLVWFEPDAVFLNPAARRLWGNAQHITIDTGGQTHRLRVAGTVSASGPPLIVMDVAAAQVITTRQGYLSRVDLLLHQSLDENALGLPGNAWLERPAQADDRAQALSRAYRVNLTVLALVALFTGAFLVFSVLSLSVARRQQQFALLGVLGLSASERMKVVLWESALLGLAGSALGIALGAALSWMALQWLGGDLGGGYFAGAAPPLQWHWDAALVYAALGTLAALAGGWWPARSMGQMAPAPALKGLGLTGGSSGSGGLKLALAAMIAAVALTLLPPIAGMSLGAYVAIALLLLGGIAALPALAGALLRQLAPMVQQRPLLMLAVERSRRLRAVAAVATSGVVASLALSVALTVMVGSFRTSVMQWLEEVLPAQLYARSGGRGLGDGQVLPPAFIDAIARLPQVDRVDGLRALQLQLTPDLPPVTLIARPLSPDKPPGTLVAPALPRPESGEDGAPVTAVFISESMRDLHGIKPGQWLSQVETAIGRGKDAGRLRLYVAGVWRDYARQNGSVLMDLDAYRHMTGDESINDISIHLHPDATVGETTIAIEGAAADLGLDKRQYELASADTIRTTSLRIFDRSFAVTYWLQAVAIGIGLFGVAASFSAQVLARRREFGLLAHLGLTRRDILGVVACEGLAWTSLGSIAGLLLGLAVSVILVHVVNPQSFHWTMDLQISWPRLWLLCMAVVVSGTVTAWLAGRSAASRDAVQAVKEDW